MNELILLRIRDLIATKEFEIAQANYETHRYGEWRSDHGSAIHYYDIEIEKLMEELGERNPK